MDFSILKQEIGGDPAGLGLAEAYAEGSLGRVIERLNKPGSGKPVPVASVQTADFVATIDPAEHAALAPEDREYLLLVASAPTVRLDNAALVGLLAKSAKSASALEAISTRPGSRAEELFGRNLTIQDVAETRKV